jgi:cytochrome c biogenesis protein CcdA/arsenate reductase-like glutaredoxin family protein
MTKNPRYIVSIILFAMLFVFAGLVPTVLGMEVADSTLIPDNGTGQQLPVDFFYNPSCASCQNVLPVIEQYEANNTGIHVNYINVVENQSTVERFIQLQKYLENPTLHVPVVVIGDHYLNGEENISANLDSLVTDALRAKNNRTLPVSPMSPPSPVSSVTSQGPGIIHFFYNPTCESCEKVLPIIEQYAVSHPEIRIEFDDLSNKTNIERFSLFRDRYPGELFYVPVVFMGDTFLEGEENITNNFNSTVESYRTNFSSGELPVEPVPAERTTSINPVVFLVAAISEGLNPCGLLVLALLLVSLMATGTRKMVFFVGIAYICAFFIVRLLSGFAIFSIIQIPGIAKVFTLAAAVIAIFAGIIQIKDGLSREQKPLLSIPASKKGLISSYMKEASILGGFIVGILVGIYGMACTAGIYITILGMLYKDLTYGLLYPILYNVIVIIPLVAILLLVFFGLPPEKVNAWREESKSLLRLMIGIVMLLMGIIILIPMI